jgi:phosphoglucosamine mutase
VVDCENGSTYHIAPHVFHELGAEVFSVGNTPDGLNINDRCGATHASTLRTAVRQHRADLGVALDGDGDRLVMVDDEGAIYDGDQLIYIIARHRRASGSLKGGVVGTLMTNLALENALKGMHLPFARAAVGDRYVLEQLLANGWQLGGEGSGHIVCLDKHTTGDGIVSALQVLHALRASNETLAQAASRLTLYPQVLINVRTDRKFDFRTHPAVAKVVAAAESDLGSQGRVLLRASGTEPVIRVMVEGEAQDKVQLFAEEIADTVRQAAA